MLSPERKNDLLERTRPTNLFVHNFDLAEMTAKACLTPLVTTSASTTQVKQRNFIVTTMVVFRSGMSTPSIYKSRRRRSIIGVSQSVVASLACLFLLVQSTRAQQIGVDVCACQPSVYEFTFDFELTCDDQSVGGAGITDTTCLTELRGEQNQEDADLLPVAVGQVSIFELDQNLDVIAQTVNTGLFLSGSTFTYTSIIATEPELLDPASLPRGIQLVFIGVNALNQAIVNTFAILYNNDCGVFPLLRVGQQAGWIIFVS
jgi:hypothetical protein